MYYDSEAERKFTDWSLLAQEIITARHPGHTHNLFLNAGDKF